MKKKILRTIIVFVVVFVAMLIVILGYNKLQDHAMYIVMGFLHYVLEKSGGVYGNRNYRR